MLPLVAPACPYHPSPKKADRHTATLPRRVECLWLEQHSHHISWCATPPPARWLLECERVVIEVGPSVEPQVTRRVFAVLSPTPKVVPTTCHTFRIPGALGV